MKHSRVNLGKIITKYPGRVLTLVLVVTLVFFLMNMNPGMFGLTMKDEESEDAWLPDNDVMNAAQEIGDNYGSKVLYLQVLIQGKDNNVLTIDAIRDTLEIEQKIIENKDVQYVLYKQPMNVTSFASSIISFIVYEENMTQLLIAQNVNFSESHHDILINSLEFITQAQIDQFILGAWNHPDPVLREQMRMASRILSKDFVNNMETGEVKAKATLMLVMYDSKKFEEIDGDNNPIVDADLEIKEIIKVSEKDFEGVEYMGIYESQYVNHVINTEGGMGLLFMMVIIVIIVILLITYRSVLDMMLSMGAIFFAIIWMNAIAIMLGLTFGSIGDVVPIILIGLGIDYAIHMTMRYDEGRKKERKAIRGAMLLAVATVGASLFLSALTTGLAFASNMASDMQPLREFGIFLMVGIICAFILVVTLIPSAKILADTSKLKRQHKKEKKLRLAGELPEGNASNPGSNPGEGNPGSEDLNKKLKESAIDRGLFRLARATARKPGPILAVALVIAIICGYMALQLSTEYDYKEWLPTRHQITDDIVYIFDNFDFGIDEADVLVKGNIADPAVLTAMRDTQINIDDDKHINQGEKYSSILTVMDDVRTPGGDFPYDQTFSDMFNNSDTTLDGIPDVNIDGLFDYLRENENYAAAVISVLHYDEGSGEYDGAVIRVYVNTNGGDFDEAIKNEMDANIEPLEKMDNVEAFATGAPIIQHLILNSISTSGLKSLAITVIIAGVILCSLFGYEFRSLAMGAMTLIPVILVVVWIYGSMYMVGIPLTVMTIMIGTITLGIGIDYAIHVTNRFMESIHDDRNVERALETTIVNTGGALFGAAVTTIFGFGILYLSPTNPMRMFGTFTAIAIGFALISSIVVLPATLGIYARRKLATDPDYFEEHVDISKVRHHVHKTIHSFDEQFKHIGSTLVEAEHKFAHQIHEAPHKAGETVKLAGHVIVTAEHKVEDTVKKAGKKGIEVSKKGVDLGVKAGKKGVDAGKKGVDLGVKAGKKGVDVGKKGVDIGVKAGKKGVDVTKKGVDTAKKGGKKAVDAPKKMVGKMKGEK
jgi:predicted RND superfamily exporter protein